MESILEQLYLGKIDPSSFAQPKSKLYNELRQKHCDHCAEFSQQLKQLDPALSRELLQVLDEQTRSISFEMVEIFRYGFRLGVRMMAEIYQENPPEDAGE